MHNWTKLRHAFGASVLKSKSWHLSSHYVWTIIQSLSLQMLCSRSLYLALEVHSRKCLTFWMKLIVKLDIFYKKWRINTTKPSSLKRSPCRVWDVKYIGLSFMPRIWRVKFCKNYPIWKVSLSYFSLLFAPLLHSHHRYHSGPLP